MDGTELLNQMNAFGTECEIVWTLRVYSDHRSRVTATKTLHKTVLTREWQDGEETQHTQITKARPKSTYLFQQTVS